MEAFFYRICIGWCLGVLVVEHSCLHFPAFIGFVSHLSSLSHTTFLALVVAHWLAYLGNHTSALGGVLGVSIYKTGCTRVRITVVIQHRIV